MKAVYTTHADLGGQMLPGAIVNEPEDERFHAAWERGAFALTLAMGATGSWNIDSSRAAREQLPDYAQLGYYGIWFEALQQLMLERSLVTPDELAQGRALSAPQPVKRVLRAPDVGPVLRRGAPTERPAGTPARFAEGQTVITRSAIPPHHTRLPAYARGRLGRIERVHGGHIFADAHAQGLGEQPQWLYAVRFEASELWGADTTASSVMLDLWEPYLQAWPADDVVPELRRGAA
jgi:nitrile hydratase subunit beta